MARIRHRSLACSPGCAVEATLQLIDGKWKGVILYHLLEGTLRFNEIRRRLASVTQRMLTNQLREMEADGLVERRDYGEIPPRVDYRLTARVAEAFKIITSDPNVKAILVNIFGGIVRCDLIADGIIQAVNQVGVKVPVVARLEGTNVEEGKRKLAESGLAILSAEDLSDAAQKVVAAAGGAN